MYLRLAPIQTLPAIPRSPCPEGLATEISLLPPQRGTAIALFTFKNSITDATGYFGDAHNAHDRTSDSLSRSGIASAALKREKILPNLPPDHKWPSTVAWARIQQGICSPILNEIGSDTSSDILSSRWFSSSWREDVFLNGSNLFRSHLSN